MVPEKTDGEQPEATTTSAPSKVSLHIYMDTAAYELIKRSSVKTGTHGSPFIQESKHISTKATKGQKNERLILVKFVAR